MKMRYYSMFLAMLLISACAKYNPEVHDCIETCADIRSEMMSTIENDSDVSSKLDKKIEWCIDHVFNYDGSFKNESNVCYKFVKKNV